MHDFKSFGIENTYENLIGDKIKAERVLNKEIVVEKYRLEDSKHFEGERCLHLQVLKGEDRHVIFTSSASLINAIERVPKDKFPFKTTIIKPDGRYLFS